MNDSNMRLSMPESGARAQIPGVWSACWSLDRQRVLVPYDFSPHSQDALLVARSFVDEPSKLTLINVVQELVAPPYLTDIVHLLDLESVKQRAEAALEQVITEAQLDGARVVVGSGRAAAAICSYAADNGVDLIVMPTHGRTGVMRFAIGSVAEGVVRTAPCAVLVLRSRPNAER